MFLKTRHSPPPLELLFYLDIFSSPSRNFQPLLDSGGGLTSVAAARLFNGRYVTFM
jgi:hypothetical protein